MSRPIKFVVDGDIMNYAKFVHLLSQSLTYRISKNDFHLLKPEQQSSGVRGEDFWQDVELEASGRRIFLRFDPTNIYLVGYRRAKTDPWWEFKPSGNGRAMIESSTLLGFSGGYGDLSKGNDRMEVFIGKEKMQQAVGVLATTDPKDKPKIVGRHLLVLILMVSEAVRIRKIFLHIQRTWGPESTAIDRQMHELTNSWGQLSVAIRKLEEQSVSAPDTPLHVNATGTGIRTLRDAQSALAFLKCDKVLPSDEDLGPFQTRRV